MTEFDYLRQVHAVLRVQCQAHPDDVVMRDLERATWSRVQAAQRRDGLPMVFRMDMPGYLEIGVLGCEQVFKHPGLTGLDDAWRIFLAGLTASNTLHASDLVEGGQRPGNALRNRMAKAAEWVEREGRCPELARAMRPPVVVITDDGRIGYRPNHHPHIDLGMRP